MEREEHQQELEDEEYGTPAVARRRSRESRLSTGAVNGTAGMTSGDVIQVDMTRLADVLGETEEGGLTAVLPPSCWQFVDPTCYYFCTCTGHPPAHEEFKTLGGIEASAHGYRTWGL